MATFASTQGALLARGALIAPASPGASTSGQTRRLLGTSSLYYGQPLKASRTETQRRGLQLAGRVQAKAEGRAANASETAQQAVAKVAKAATPSDSQVTTSVEPAAPPPRASAYPGTPLMWVGVGVGATVVFLKIAGRVKEQAQKAAMAALMKQMGAGPGADSPFGGPNPFGAPGSNPFGAPGSNPFSMPPPSSFPPPPPPPPAQPTPSTTQTAAASSSTAAPVAEESAAKAKAKSGFQDVNVDNIKAEEDQRKSEARERKPFFQDAEVVNNASSSGDSTGGWSSNTGSQGKKSPFTVEMLEKMMEDPLVQKMIYPHLPEEMRNPATFKWMMQNPAYRQQLEAMLQDMGTGDGLPFDERMLEMAGKFDINSPEIKQQFEQIGMTPEDMIGKIMANPEVAMAFRNPRVQAAIMDVSTNPLNITKYQNDKEVMDVFMKITELFPGMA